MVDTIFRGVKPSLKAVDNGDGTFTVALTSMAVAGVGTDTIFPTSPPLKAIDNGDGTYSVAISLIT